MSADSLQPAIALGLMFGFMGFVVWCDARRGGDKGYRDSVYDKADRKRAEEQAKAGKR